MRDPKAEVIVLAEPLLYLVAFIVIFLMLQHPESTVASEGILACAAVALFRGLILRRYKRKRWGMTLTRGQQIKTSKVMLSARLHWTEKLNQLQEQTGAMTLLASYGNLLLCLICVGAYVFLLRQ